MILDGSSAHSFGSMMDSSDTVLHKDSFLQDFQMMGDAFFLHFFCSMMDCSYTVLFTKRSIFQDFQMFVDGFFV